jgi:hypothetical protein
MSEATCYQASHLPANNTYRNLAHPTDLASNLPISANPLVHPNPG